MNSISHLGALTGRIFLISNYADAMAWSGSLDSDESGDYELLESVINFEEIDLTRLITPDGRTYSVYFSMASKIELFTTNEGLVLLDSLYFDEELLSYGMPSFEDIRAIPGQFKVTGNEVTIFDSTISGETISSYEQGLFAVGSNNFRSYANLQLPSGLYSSCLVHGSLTVDDQILELEGIRIFPS